jgi:flavodoxin I
MNILLSFATYSGSTQTAAEFAAEKLKENDHTVTLKNIQETTPDELENFDIIVFATPSWSYEGKDGHPHVHFMDFINKVRGKNFSGKSFAIMGLGDSAYPNFCGAVQVLEDFVKDIQGSLITESLRMDGYFFNQAENEQKITDWVQHIGTPK